MNLNFIIRLIKKLFFYFLLFTGIILSTSHLGDNYMGISDGEGYLLAIGICCLLILGVLNIWLAKSTSLSQDSNSLDFFENNFYLLKVQLLQLLNQK